MSGDKRTEETDFFDYDTWNHPSTSSGIELKRSGESKYQMNTVEYTKDELDTHIQVPKRDAKSSGCDLGRVDEKQFTLLHVLGSGAYGKVFLVRKLMGADKDRLYAMKVINKKKSMLNKKIAKHTKWEREVLETIRNIPFLITLRYAFQTDSKLYLVLNYVAGGDLGSYLCRKIRFTKDEVQFYVGEITLALQSLHKLGIIYRDIKPENILIDEFGHVVLTDFGLSKQIGIGNRAHTFCGTIDYIAPEVARCGYPEIGDNPPEACQILGYDFSVDWWSVGVLTYELLVGILPFSHLEGADFETIATSIITSSPYIPDLLGEISVNFISKLLTKDPTKRLGHGKDDAETVKRHPFFENLDWDKLLKKEISPPFKPIIENELDISNFNPEQTELPPIDSPVAAPANYDKIFVGYSFSTPESHSLQ